MRDTSRIALKGGLESEREITRRWSTMNTIGRLACAASLSLMAVTAATADTVTYTSDSAYFAAAGPQSLQDFDSPTLNTPYAVQYRDVTVLCGGPGLCLGAVGDGVPTPITGLEIIFGSTSVLTFTFTSPIHSFGIYIAGLGTAGPTTFSISNSNGFVANLFTNYEGTTVSFDTPLFAGLVSDSRFDAVSLWGTAVGDGIALDNLYYGHASPSAVPGAIVGAGLPGLVAACGGLLALAQRRRRQRS
jgi:hypothetical protein